MVRMPLKQAQGYAAKIVDWLRPYCERIEIAGEHPPRVHHLRRRGPCLHSTLPEGSEHAAPFSLGLCR